MSEYLIQGETLTSIADAIRAKSNSIDPISAADMPEAIEAIMTSANFIDNVKELKSGKFTPTSKVKEIYLDLWEPYLDYKDENNWSVTSRVGGFVVRRLSGGTEPTDYLALVGSFWQPYTCWVKNYDIKVEQTWGSAVKQYTPYYGYDYGARLPVGSRGSTRYRLYLSSTSGTPDVYFWPGATYEWMAWRYKD